MKFQRARLDLTTPPEPGEEVYADWQQSRFARFLNARLSTIATIGVIVVVAIVASTGTYALSSAAIDQRRADDDAANRRRDDRQLDENRVTGCVTIRDIQLAHNALVERATKAQQNLTTNAFTGFGARPATPEIQSFIDLLNTQTAADLAASIIPDVRDCSKKGIADYFANRDTPDRTTQTQSTTTTTEVRPSASTVLLP